MAGESDRFFNIGEGLSPLNAYFEFADRDRILVMASLLLATSYLPNADEYYIAKQEGPSGEMRMEDRYGMIADTFARLAAETSTDREEVLEKRGKFYTMIRTLTAEQVASGIQRIMRSEIKPQS